MVSIQYVREQDRAFWLQMAPRTSDVSFMQMVRDRQGYVLFDRGIPVGVMYYNLIWDKLPFLNLLSILPAYQRQGVGRAAMAHWEADMQAKGYQMVLLSTQVDETAQHFYRKLGYTDCGCLVLHHCPLAQPMEMFFCKTISE